MNAKAAKKMRRELRAVIAGDPVDTDAMGRALVARVGLTKLAREFRRDQARQERKLDARPAK